MTARIDTDGHEIKTAIKWSISLHAALIFAMIFKGIFFPQDTLVVEDSIRVDLVALPDKVRALPPLEAEVQPTQPSTVTNPVEPNTSAASPPAQQETAASPSPATKPIVLSPSKPQRKTEKIRDSQAQSLKRLEAMKRLESQARQDAAKRALDLLKSQQLKGNQLSTGNSLSGLTRLDHNRYLGAVEAKIKQQWRPPKFLARAQLKVRVLILIARDGQILRSNLVQSSGNAAFDESAMVAMTQASPLPEPPEAIQTLLENQGIEIDLEPNTQ